MTTNTYFYGVRDVLSENFDAFEFNSVSGHFLCRHVGDVGYFDVEIFAELLIFDFVVIKKLEIFLVLIFQVFHERFDT